MPAPTALRAKAEGRAYCESPALLDICGPRLTSNEPISLLGIKSELVFVCQSLKV